MDEETLLVEKAVILVSIVAALPLFFLDGPILGLKRYAWLVAFSTGLFRHVIFLREEGGMAAADDETGIMLDKVTMAAASMAVIPHYVKLMEDNLWLGGSALPPLLVAGYLGTQTEQGSKEYWKLRAFMFVATFFVPYLNHLPSGKVDQEIVDGQTETKEDEGAATADSTETKNETTTTGKSKAASQSKRTNKKKR